MHTKTTQVLELDRLRNLISVLSLLTAIGGRKHPDIDGLKARALAIEADLNPLRDNHEGRPHDTKA